MSSRRLVDEDASAKVEMSPPLSLAQLCEQQQGTSVVLRSAEPSMSISPATSTLTAGGPSSAGTGGVTLLNDDHGVHGGGMLLPPTVTAADGKPLSEDFSMDSIDVVMSTKRGGAGATTLPMNPRPPTAEDNGPYTNTNTCNGAAAPLMHNNDSNPVLVETEVPKDEVDFANAVVVSLGRTMMSTVVVYSWSTDGSDNHCYMPQLPDKLMVNLLSKSTIGGTLTRRETLALMQWNGNNGLDLQTAEQLILNIRENISDRKKATPYDAPTLPLVEGRSATTATAGISSSATAPDFNSSLSNFTVKTREDHTQQAPYHPIIGAPVRSDWIGYPLLRATADTAAAADEGPVKVIVAADPTHKNTGPVEWDPFFGPPVRKRTTTTTNGANGANGRACFTTLADPIAKQRWLKEKIADLERR